MAIDGYLTEDQLATKIGRSTRTLQIWRQRRQGPAWTCIGKTIIYRDAAFQEWLKSQEQQPVRSKRKVA